MRKNGAGDNEKSGFSRRGLFAGGGVSAAAAIVGLDSTGNAAASSVSTRRTTQGLRASNPHARTGRTQQPPRNQDPDIRVLPLNRAKFLAGARFDLRVEATGVDPETARINIDVEGPNGPAPILSEDPERSSSEDSSLEVTYHDLVYPEAGSYAVRARLTSRQGQAEVTVSHEVVVAEVGEQQAKNVIFFLGDGMGQPAITAARILSKGMVEGKYNNLLEIDQMEYRGLVGTSGADSIATDSANSMSAYMTGHKSSVNAMGVYEGNDPDPNNHPRVENVTELLKRSRDMAIGIVTTAEVQDATPAAVWAHTRQRAEYLDIMDQALTDEQMPDVLMGGGRASLLPQSHEDSERDDDRNLIEEFAEHGFTFAGTRAELKDAVSGVPDRLLGLFHPGNLNVYLDREHSPDPDVLGEWTDQPTLVEQTEAALEVLENRDEGFFLMVEGASIDKMEHPLDGPRAVYDMIEFDQAIGVARRWAEDRDDTLIVITADHNHSMSIVGTNDRREGNGRQSNGVYADAGFPTYSDDDGDGFPDDPNPDIGLFYGWSNHPHHTDDFEHNEVFLEPALVDEETDEVVPNPERDPDAEVQTGNLPDPETNCVHTVEDVSVFASGPGADRFNAFLDNTEIFFAMMDALGLDAQS